MSTHLDSVVNVHSSAELPSVGWPYGPPAGVQLRLPAVVYLSYCLWSSKSFSAPSTMQHQFLQSPCNRHSYKHMVIIPVWGVMCNLRVDIGDCQWNKRNHVCNSQHRSRQTRTAWQISAKRTGIVYEFIVTQ